MSGSQVTVLCPNGRRVIVKTTPGLSILQVIENACEKQKLNPDLYDIRLLRRTLDPSSTIRFSNIPNNAQLELFQSASPRKAGPVNISLATESGERLIAEFSPTETFMAVLQYHEQKGSLHLPSKESGQVPVVVYTMERLSGERLNSTTLKSLGIVKGSYMLRYLVQNIENEGNLQLCGSGALVKPKVARVEEPHNSRKECAMADSSTDRPRPEILEARQMLPPRVLEQLHDAISNPDIVKSASRSEIPDVLCSEKIQSPPDVLKLSSIAPSTSSDPSPGFDLVESHVAPNPEGSNREDQPMEVGGAMSLVPETEERIIPLGSHNSLLFSLDDAPTTVTEEEDDSFFELSLNEIRRLHMEQMRVLKELEEAPLMTEKIRTVEQEGKLLSALRNHPTTQIRIVFPDRLVIQATFKPHDTIGTVQDFIRQFLNQPQMDFFLYTIFPKKVLDPSLSLVDADCIPNARLYFGAHGQIEKFISDEALHKKSSFVGAQRAIKKNRAIPTHPLEATSMPSPSYKKSTPPASSQEPQHQDSQPVHRVSQNQKMPKWFKLAK